jgi:signal transduction histidine kinase
MIGPSALIAAAGLLLIAGCALVANRRRRGRSAPGRFIGAAARVASLAEECRSGADFSHRLQGELLDWSDGSREIFLSGGAEAPLWPDHPVPQELIDHLESHLWATPESLRRAGKCRSGLDYMIEKDVAAVVCHVARSREKFLAAFSGRSSRRPFTPEELRQALGLLRIAQVGASAVRLGQELRGNERLGFYSRHGPQLAQELRNGFYLQAKLLQTIAAGRGADVLPADAELALGRLENIDRLCDHFFAVGALFNRALGPVLLNDRLEAAARELTALFADKHGVVLRLKLHTPSDLRVMAEPGLLGAAVLNLVKTRVAAIEGNLHLMLIEVVSHLDTRQVRIQVCDNGPGFAPDRAADVFAPGASGKFGGPGFGLSIARDCVEAMGGTLRLESRESGKTSFEIALERVPD